MASEMTWRHTATGETLYFTIRSSANTYWNTDTDGPALETLTVANWYNASTSAGNYWISLSESPASSYFYVGTIPAALASGWYWVDVYKRAGGAPAITDTLQGTIVGYWDGTSLLPWASNAKTVSDKTGYSLTAATGLGNQTADITGTVSGNATTAEIADVPTNSELAAAFTEIKGATWATTDTLEAIRDRGDAAWVTATGFSTHSAADVVTALGTGSTLTALATAAALGDVPTNAELTAAITALLTTQMTESYNADGTAPTVAQALFVIMQRLTEFAISSTTITVKKLDGSTTALTLSLDDATTPTSSTRAT